MIRLYVDDRLGATELTHLRAGDLDDLYGQMLRGGRRDGRGGLSPRTVRYLHTILNKALSDAVRTGRLRLNPAAAAEPPSARAARAPVFPVWSPAELARFLDAARDDPHYVAFYLAAATGLRRGELLGLRWRDVNLAGRELHVVQAVVEVDHEPRLAPPKTERSRRLVALDTRTVEILTRYRLRKNQEGAEPDGDSLIFSRPGGAPIHPALFSYYFQRRVGLAGVRRIRLHDLRHTHATHALSAGVHPKVVSERLGHSTIAITLDTYSHVMPGMQREAAEAVAALVHA